MTVIISGDINKGFRADNAATEKTLSDILDYLSNKGIKKGILKDVEKAADRFKDTGDASDKLKKSFLDLKKNADFASRYAFESFVKKGGTAGSEISDFGDMVNATGQSIGKSFKKIPYVGAVLGGTLGILGTGFGAMAGYAQNLLDHFTSLSTVGADLGGSFLDINRSAAASAMTMSEFTAIVKQNSELFSTIGPNIGSVSKNFGLLSKGVRSFNNFQLSAMGYTFGEINDVLLDYMAINKTNSTIGTQLAKTDSSLITSSVKYAKELDGLSRLTGKNRKDLSQSVREQVEQAKVQLKLLNLEDQGNDNARESFTTAAAAAASLGPGFQRAFDQAFTLGTGEDLNQLRIAAPQTAMELMKLSDQIKMNQKVDASKVSLDLAYAAKMDSSRQKQLEVLASTNPAFADFAKITLASAARLRTLEGTIIEEEKKKGLTISGLELEAAVRKRFTEQMQKEAGETASLSKISEKLRNAFKKVEDAFLNSEVFTGLFKIFDHAMTYLSDGIISGLKYLSDNAENIDKFIMNTFKSIKDWITSFIQGVDQDGIMKTVENKIINPLSAGISTLMDNLIDKIIPKITSLIEQNAGPMKEQFMIMIDKITSDILKKIKESLIPDKIGPIETGVGQRRRLEREGIQAPPNMNDQDKSKWFNDVDKKKAEIQKRIDDQKAIEDIYRNQTPDPKGITGMKPDDLRDVLNQEIKKSIEFRTEMRDFMADPGKYVPQRKEGGSSGRGGLFQLHANEFVLNERMIVNINDMIASLMNSIDEMSSMKAQQHSNPGLNFERTIDKWMDSITNTKNVGTSAFDRDSIDRLTSLPDTIRSELGSLKSAIIAELAKQESGRLDPITDRVEKSTRNQTLADFSRPEKEQFAVTIETRDLTKDLKESIAELVALFKMNLNYSDEGNRTLKDMLDIFETQRT